MNRPTQLVQGFLAAIAARDIDAAVRRQHEELQAQVAPGIDAPKEREDGLVRLAERSPAEPLLEDDSADAVVGCDTPTMADSGHVGGVLHDAATGTWWDIDDERLDSPCYIWWDFWAFAFTAGI